MKTSLLALGSLVLVLAAPGCAPDVTSGAPDSVGAVFTDPGKKGDYRNVVAPGNSNEGGACGNVELHVVGIYDPNDAQQGPATVHIDRPGSVMLFLSAYSKTDWSVTAGPDTELVEVIANGYEPQTVVAPAGVPTTAFSFETGGDFLGCGYEYPDQDPTSGCETPELFAAVSAYTQLPISSYHGCYQASDFTINADLTSWSTCATGAGYAHTTMVATECTDPPTDPGNACTGKTGTGQYEGFFCDPVLYPNGGPFIQTADISCEDALANCALNASANPGISIECTWNGEQIFLEETQPGDCGP